MKGWSDLGVVETIYEEEDDEGEEDEDEDEDEESSLNSSSPSPRSPFSTSLSSRVEAWSAANRCEPDVLIRVQGTSFRLHKDPLTSRSSYLLRRLTARSDITLSPPLNITADTFRVVADFCYGARIAVTPFNVAALRTAAELLEMTDGDGDGGDDLRLVAETSFRRFASVNKEYVKILFRSCLDMLPEAETAAWLVSRCTEAFNEIDRAESQADDRSSEGAVAHFLEGIVTVGIKEFEATVESMSSHLSSHDVIYQMVNIYIKEHGGKITEEHKAQICQSVDCTKLSPELLVHAVQNPKMPLRFIIRAMLVEQIRTRHSFLHAAAAAASAPHPSSRLFNHPRNPSVKAVSSPRTALSPAAPTLGSILNRDAALRQSAQLRASMAATRSRIESLEEELGTMKLRLMNEMTGPPDTSSAEDDVPTESSSVLNSSRSLSFGHYGVHGENKKIKRGERGSVSSLSLRSARCSSGGGGAVMDGSTAGGGSPCGRRSMQERLISGLKSAFGSSNSSPFASKGGPKGRARDVHAAHGKAFSPLAGF